ncbi:MAG: hypothetical protein ACXWXI_11315 [Aeromicrobium sp.]
MNTNAPGPGERPEGQEAPDDAAADAGSESPEEGAAAMAAAEDATVDTDGD